MNLKVQFIIFDFTHKEKRAEKYHMYLFKNNLNVATASKIKRNRYVFSFKRNKIVFVLIDFMK